MDERQPHAAAVGVEARGVEGALVEQGPVRLAAGGVPWLRRDELVDVLEALVIAHVERDATIGSEGRACALVLGASERGALHRLRLRVVGVDLDHPAEAVRLVRVLRGVEPLVVELPLVAAPLADAVAALVGRRCAGGNEEELPVLLAGEIRPPRRPAIGAAVVGAEHLAAGGIRSGAHRRRTRRRSGDRAWRIGGDPARVFRRPDDFPTTGLQAHLDHRDADGGLRLAHLLGAPGPGAVGEQQPIVEIFVIHREQTVSRRIGAVRQRVEPHPIVVHARLHRLVGRAVRRIRPERGHVAGNTDRVAPAKEHRRVVLRRDLQRVVGGRRDRRKAHGHAARGRRCAAREREHRGDRGGEAAFQECAACEPCREDGREGRRERAFCHWRDPWRSGERKPSVRGLQFKAGSPAGQARHRDLDKGRQTP